MKQREEVVYSPLVVDELGNVSLESEEVVRSGYLLYWGQSTSVKYFLNEQNVNVPIVENIVIAVVQDKESGKVRLSFPQSITFKPIDKRNDPGYSPGK